ncbi:hypothetical protein FF36_01891 [Frankia torreyi]|uniref:Uncharacterized protein n=1 Tax=Frankia torreyi TaxID=1856 RepID=A0A0D8BHW3_9ACTN|nr:MULTISPECIES: hypothetical protein [Frankia]KJE23706.1 hypothetical protein FF36_01891 [Frankia torreyi]
MEGTAFIVSIISLLVAVGSAVYARQVARIERERRRDERQPTFSGTIEMEPESVGGWYSHLHLRLESPWPLTRLTASVIEGHGVEFTPDQDSIDPSSSVPRLRVQHGALRTGDQTDWLVRVLEDRSERICLRVICGDDARRQWETTVYVTTPPQLSHPMFGAWR